MVAKRKSVHLALDRRVRARREDDWNAAVAIEHSSEETSDEETAHDGEEYSLGSETDADSEELSEASEADERATSSANLASLSFGALARAQDSLSAPLRKSRLKQDKTADDTPDIPTRSEAKTRPNTEHPKASGVKRTSKHAPQEQTSKKPVTRRREILPDLRRKYRDPRFDVVPTRLDEAKSKQAYAFLNEYRDSEMADLRAQIKKLSKDKDKDKNTTERDELKKQLMSMESQRRARDKKDNEERLLREHRAQEKEAVAQGKKPFYLKKSEQKRRLLVDKFDGMSKRQVDKAM